MNPSIYVVHSNPVPGREDEYNEWYTNEHLNDIVSIPGFVRARRFEVTPGQESSVAEYRYLAIYEISGDPAVAIANMWKAVEAGLHLSEALQPTLIATTYTAITDWVAAS